MKVLFVCYANVGRSQVAEAVFRTRSRHDCSSAGIAADERVALLPFPSKKLKHAAIQHSIKYVRRELGVDIGEKERQQLLPGMIDASDLVVVIAEKERWPDYLKEGGKILFWDIQDPAGMDDALADVVYRDVQRRAELLVAEIG